MSVGPSPLYPTDPNYTGTPYVVQWPAMAGDVYQSIASLRSLRLSLIQIGLKPSYSVHGHQFSWTQLNQFINDCIEAMTKEARNLECFEFISAVR